jgi:hypothetical protein
MLHTLKAKLQRCAEEQSIVTHTLGPALFRVLAGLNILWEFLGVHSHRHVLFGLDGIVPYATWVRVAPITSVYRYATTPWAFELVYHASILVVLIWILGYATRFTTPLVLVCWSSLIGRTQGIWDAGDTCARLILMLFCFADSSRHFSLGSSSPDQVERTPALGLLHNMALRAAGVQVSIVYFVAGLAKARGSTWLDGSALYAAFTDGQFSWPGVTDLLIANDAVLSILGPITIFFQISFPFFFFLSQKTRLAVLATAISFHLCIGVFMGLLTFAVFFIAAELALISDAEYRVLLAPFRRRARASSDGIHLEALSLESRGG